MRINFIQLGKGPAWVLLHGWAFDAQIWLSFAQSMIERFTFYLVDLPGHGSTPWMDEQVFHQQLLDVLPEQFTLIGWSLGGIYATRIALAYPQRVEKLMNIASSPCFLQKENWPGIQAQLLTQMYEGLCQAPQQTLKQFLQMQGLKKNTLGKQASLVGLKEGLKLLQDSDLREAIPQLAMPIHYSFGRLDRIVPYDTFKQMQVSFPQIKYHLFKKAAHLPFLTAQAEFEQMVSDFMPKVLGI